MMGKHPREGRVSYVVQQFIPSEPKPGPLAHWADRLATTDRAEAYGLATALGRCRVYEFEVVRLQSGRLATRERKGSPFRVGTDTNAGVRSGGQGGAEGVQSDRDTNASVRSDTNASRSVGGEGVQSDG